MKETKLKIKGKKAPKIKPKSFANNWAIYLYRFIKEDASNINVII